MFEHASTISPVEFTSKDGPKGRFYTTPSGERYPSITTVLGAGDKPWLAEWRSSLGAANADKEMARAAVRGTAVHLMLERYLQNDPNPSRDQHISHVAEFNSTKMFVNKLSNIVAQEIPLYSDTLQVAGRVDCIAEYNGRITVVDFKTSTNSKTGDMIQDYFKQTAFYAIAFHEMYGIYIEDLHIIMSVEKGLPLCFNGKVSDYIKPLVQSISKYHKAYPTLKLQA